MNTKFEETYKDYFVKTLIDKYEKSVPKNLIIDDKLSNEMMLKFYKFLIGDNIIEKFIKHNKNKKYTFDVNNVLESSFFTGSDEFELIENIQKWINKEHHNNIKLRFIGEVSINISLLMYDKKNKSYYVIHFDKIIYINKTDYILQTKLIMLLFFSANLLIDDFKKIKKIIYLDGNNGKNNEIHKNNNGLIILQFFKLERLEHFKYFINGNKPDYNFLNELTIKRVIDDDELEKIFNDDVKPKKIKKTKKTQSPINEPIENMNYEPEPIENKPIENMNYEPEPIENYEPELNNIIIEPNYFTKTKDYRLSYNHNEYFTLYDKTYISIMLSNLYERNEKFKLFIIDNKYDYIRIIKNIHYDYSFKDKSKHITIKFYNSYDDIRSNSYHAYISSDDEIISLTTLIDVLD